MPVSSIGALPLGFLGVGRWGARLLAAFAQHPECVGVWACDPDERRHGGSPWPGLRWFTQVEAALNSASVRAVVIATPAATHFELAAHCLRRGLSVFIEKPLCLREWEARELEALAVQHGATVMVGHVYLFHPAVVALRERFRRGDWGRLCYVHGLRTQWGPVRSDADVLWDLAPHDLSILFTLLGSPPRRAKATTLGGKGALADSALLRLEWDGGLEGLFHYHWKDPRRSRRLTFFGTRQIVSFCEDGTSELVTWEAPPQWERRGVEALQECLAQPGRRDSFDGSGALLLEAGAFVDELLHGRPQPSGLGLGRDVVACLEGATSRRRRPGPLSTGSLEGIRP